MVVFDLLEKMVYILLVHILEVGTVVVEVDMVLENFVVFALDKVMDNFVVMDFVVVNMMALIVVGHKWLWLLFVCYACLN